METKTLTGSWEKIAEATDGIALYCVGVSMELYWGDTKPADADEGFPLRGSEQHARQPNSPPAQAVWVRSKIDNCRVIFHIF